MSQDFYIGYAERPPANVARFLARSLIVAYALTAILALAMAFGFDELPAAFFEFGQVRTLKGRIVAEPYPMLEIARPGQSREGADRTRLLLSLLGKEGAGELAARFDDRAVRLSGTLAYRGDQALLEVLEDSVELLEDDEALPAAGRQGEADLARLAYRSLEGEIVGAKCFLGVMNPGQGRVHADCASLCIRGGIPALFLPYDAKPGERAYLFLDAEGRAHDDSILEWVGRPIRVEAKAEATEARDWPRLQADLSAVTAIASAFEPSAASSLRFCSILP